MRIALRAPSRSIHVRAGQIIPPRLLERSSVYYVLVGKVASKFFHRQAVKPSVVRSALGR
ncbi:MAG: hypothetical protein QOI46_5937 [Alphaproteobacteria bacterium]|nr:hypothetical protein [Alphaproteobacteria bacterium]